MTTNDGMVLPEVELLRRFIAEQDAEIQRLRDVVQRLWKLTAQQDAEIQRLMAEIQRLTLLLESKSLPVDSLLLALGYTESQDVRDEMVRA